MVPIFFFGAFSIYILFYFGGGGYLTRLIVFLVDHINSLKA